MPNPQNPSPSLRGLTYAQAQAQEAGLADQSYQDFIDNLGSFSMAMSIGGNVTQAIGNYYAVQQQQAQLESQALSMDFAAQVAELNMNLTEQAVARMGEARQQQLGLLSMQTAERRAAAATSAAGRGVKIDSGSAIEQQSAIELMSQVDAMTLEANFEERISAAERGAATQKSQALLSRVSASNIRSTARSISPEGAYLSTEIGGAARVSGMFYDRFGVDRRGQRLGFGGAS